MLRISSLMMVVTLMRVCGRLVSLCAMGCTPFLNDAERNYRRSARPSGFHTPVNIVRCRMLVLHAAFLDDSLAVWLEPESGKAALAGAAGELGLTLKFAKRIAKAATAWLPTSGGRAAPSSALLADAPAEDACEIAPHTVTVLPLEGEPLI